MMIEKAYLSFYRVPRIIFFCTCLFLLLVQARKCVVRYRAQETGVSVRLRSSKETTFPAFTLCPNWNAAYNDTFLREHGTSRADYRYGVMHKPINTTDLALFHRQASLRLDELVERIEVESNDTNEHGTRMTKLDAQTPDVWTDKPIMLFGVCYTLTMPKALIRLGISDIKFYFHGSPYIYIHHPGQYMDPDSKAKISMLPTKMMFIDIDFELLYLLEGDHSFECSNSMNFLYDECVDNEAVSEQLKKYGCKAPDTIIGQHHPTCDLSRWNQSEQREFNTFRSNQRFQAVNKLCNPPCASLSFTHGLPDTSSYKKDQSYVKMYFKRNVLETRFALSYEGLSMLAEIGGYSGVLLGFSMFHMLACTADKLLNFYGKVS